MKKRKGKRKIISRTRKIVILNIVLVCFFMLGIGYSVLSTSLTMYGLLNVLHWNDPLRIEMRELSSPANGTEYQYGETVISEVKVTNNSHKTINNIEVLYSMCMGTSSSDNIATLAPGETVTLNHTSSAWDSDMIYNHVVVSAYARGTNSKGEDVSGEHHLVSEYDVVDYYPSDLSITVSADDKEYELGEEVTFNITAYNMNPEANTITLTASEGVTLEEETFQNVAPYEEVEITAERTITEDDIINGYFKVRIDSAVGHGRFSGECTVQTEPKNGHLTVSVEIQNKKEEYKYHDLLEYYVIVENDGNLSITNINFLDELTGDGTTITRLYPGNEKRYHSSYYITPSDIEVGSVTLSQIVTGTSPDEDDPNVPVDYVEEIIQTEPVNRHIALSITPTSSQTSYDLGEDFLYSLLAENDGNVDLNNISISALNPSGSVSSWTLDSFGVGITRPFNNLYHTITESDILAGDAVITANAKSSDNSTINTIYYHIPVAQKKSQMSITIVEETNQSVYHLGDYATYHITLKNEGNLTLSDITLDVFEFTRNVGSLAPNATYSQKFTNRILQSMVDAGEFCFSANATATSPDPNNSSVSASKSYCINVS